MAAIHSSKRVQMIGWYLQAEEHTTGEESRGLWISDLCQMMPASALYADVEKQ